MNKFVFVTPAFNCQEKIEQTIRSVYSQSFRNWRIIIYDDMSTDNTAQIAEDLSKKLSLGERLQVISRTEKYGEVRNTLDAIQTIENDEIVCRLDAGDWLTENDALYILDDVYQRMNPAVAWTMHRWAYTSTNISGPLNEKCKDVYTHPWVSSHLKTFRRSSIDNIDRRNFLDSNGDYIMIACDQAIFLPMMQKAILEEKPLVFIPIVTYHYDIDLKNPNLFTNQRSINQKTSAEWIRQRGFIK